MTYKKIGKVALFYSQSQVSSLPHHWPNCEGWCVKLECNMNDFIVQKNDSD